ncbi:nurim [Poecilia reticulata]|uniref:nurim n=1 Tax=Poecilia reticulata TaxID=8081 RepID=UPI0007EA7490|nr:PREDICTED: nurim [Poecilia reticulata]
MEPRRCFGSCAGCGEAVLAAGGACQAMGRLFHNTCFTCSVCSKQLKGQPFFTVSGHIYCEDDFLFSGVHPSEETCYSCGSSITDLTGAAGSGLCCGFRLQGLLCHRLSQGPVSPLRCLQDADTAHRDSVPWSVALKDSSVLWALFVDLSLLALFVAQHSLMASAPVKRALQSQLGALNRTAYCFSTALALQCLELAVILWLLPAFPLDRLLLAGTLSAYVGMAHSLDKQDLAYLCGQFKGKVWLLAEPLGGAEQNGSSLKEKEG